MFAVVITTTVYDVASGQRVNIKNVQTSTLGGFLSQQTAQDAANRLRVNTANWDRQAAVVKL